jgi:peptide/nickel transport system permease protein
VKSAKARGLDQKQINRRHILRNGLVESNTVIAVMFGWLITGDLIVEEIFAWPGIGKFAYTAISTDDYPVLIFTVITFTILVIVANLIADIMYAVLDPRIRLGGSE